MKEKIHYSEVFKAVEKAVEAGAAQLVCSECGKGFYKITTVGIDEPDYIIEEGHTYKCSDHVVYDLLFNPEITQPIILSSSVPKKIRKLKTRIEIRKIDAQLFIPNRYN